MPDHIALLADHNVLLVALAGEMPHLVAFETDLFRALKRVMSVLTTQNAIQAQSLIGTVPLHVAELFTIATLNRWVLISIVACHLAF